MVLQPLLTSPRSRRVFVPQVVATHPAVRLNPGRGGGLAVPSLTEQPTNGSSTKGTGAQGQL